MVPGAPPTRKNRRTTSCPAPISANVPYIFASRLIWSAFRFVPTSISGFIADQDGKLYALLNCSIWEGALIQVARAALLQPHQLHRIGLNPAAKLIRESGINPIAAHTEDFDFAARRQNENAVCVVRRRQARLHL